MFKLFCFIVKKNKVNYLFVFRQRNERKLLEEKMHRINKQKKELYLKMVASR